MNATPAVITETCTCTCNEYIGPQWLNEYIGPNGSRMASMINTAFPHCSRHGGPQWLDEYMCIISTYPLRKLLDQTAKPKREG
jgi:hypothetical protein